MSLVFLEGIGWDPEYAVGALGYARNLLAGETSQSGYADPRCQLPMCAPIARCPAGTRSGCSFTWLSPCTETMGMTVAQSQGHLD